MNTNVTTENRLINCDFNISYINNAFEFEQPVHEWYWGPLIENHSSLMLILEGEGMFFINNEPYHIKKGNIVYVKKGAHYRGAGLVCPEGEIWKYISIRFDTSEEIDILDTIYHTENIDYFKRQFQEIVTAFHSKRFAYIPKCKGLLYSLLCSVISDSYIASKSPREYNIIKSSIDYMNKNVFSYDLSIDAIAAQSGISSKYFRNLFKKFYGISPVKHIINLRLARARELLCFSNLTISQISEEIGYSSEIYFYRLFKQTYHITPSEFRQKMKV